MNKIFISFIEEMVLNPAYQDYIGGRIEVSRQGDAYPFQEIRFFTKDVKGFHAFRDAWDMLNITKKDLDYLRKVVREAYYEPFSP
ncbi:MAG: hypothetical protein EHM49_09075 [Deltaproteobacteria bacterium]|nr:MAG: hypothetical protein EHM49_09075 [Deltaproteobacteria bacterium]